MFSRKPGCGLAGAAAGRAGRFGLGFASGRFAVGRWLAVASPELVALPAAVGPESPARLEHRRRGRRERQVRLERRSSSRARHALLEPAGEMVSQRLRVRVVLVDRVMKLRDQPLDQRHLLFGDPQPLLGFAEGLFLVGVGDGVASLLQAAAGEGRPAPASVFRPLLDLRLPVAELVALEPVAHPAQLHVNPAERVRASSAKVDHRDLEVLERLDGQDVG